jgi:outer membrane receptor protein involved in Fe transport
VAGTYLMGRWLRGQWDVTAGARLEATDAHYATHDATVQAEVGADKTYTDILPSLSVRYAMTDALGLRLSAGQSITRPRFYDLVPYNYVSGEFRYSGNPYLKRTITTSVDLSADLDAGAGGRYAGSLFYKRIIDPIESTLDLSNPALPAIIPNNLANATAFGARLSGRVDILSTLGLEAAYVYTHSAITSDKLSFDRSQGKALQVPVTRSLQGEPEQAATVALVLSRPAWGTSGRIAFTYTGRLLRQVSLFVGTDHYEEPFPLLDLSVEQRLADDLSVYARLDNLLDATRSVRLPDGTPIEREKPGIAGTIGASWRY